MTAPVLATAAGAVEGVDCGGALRILGVPYGRAARFRPPEPPEPWTGRRDGRQARVQAPQVPSRLDQFLGTAGWPLDEDCLQVNVWTPATDGARRPVLVWFHGGAFTNGAAAAPWFDGEAFARGADAVLVSVGYRLGVLGYTHLADVAGERFAGSGNLGLLDQIAALRWVREHAASIGGDPGRVTAFGESAGGTSVLALLACPAASGLFQRAIAMSPSCTQLRSRERADEAARQVLQAAGLAPDEAHRLTELPLDRLLAAQQQVQASGPAAFTAFAPTPDGTVLDRPVLAALAAGAGRDVPLVVGATRDEMHLFTAFDPVHAGLDRAGLVARLRPPFADRAPEVADAYAAARPGWSPGQLASAAAGDHAFRAPARRLADARARLGAPTWSYLFAWPSPAMGGVLGACHGLDLPFTFDNLDAPGVTAFTGDGPERAAVAAAVHGAWTRFAGAGDPGWVPHGPARPTMVFDEVSTVVDDPDGSLLDLWPGGTGAEGPGLRAAAPSGLAAAPSGRTDGA